MEKLNRTTAPQAKKYTEKIIQFGEGNFLRAFIEWIIWKTNQKTDFNGSVVVVQPIEKGMVGWLNEQDGLYHLNLQGLQNGQPVDSVDLIDVVSRGLNPYEDFDAYLKLAEQPEIRFVISNTTEAGIAFDPACKFTDKPASSYPGKLTQLLYHRFDYFSGDMSRGLILFPCELIFENGKHLKECILQYIDLWQLGEDFRNWFLNACGVYSTLVDRIVPGYPRDTAEQLCERVGYKDNLLDKAEIFHLWVIEAPKEIAAEFPADQAGLNVLFVPSEAPYHERKVTLLNGPHTVLSPVGYLSGLNTVKECCEDELVGPFVRRVMYEELLPTLNLPKEELVKFADDVMERFRNPFVKHFVTSIMLNSFPKFKTRDLPGLKTYLERMGELPKGIVLGLAAICTYYKGGKRGDDEIVPNDDPKILELLQKLWATGDIATVARGVLADEFIWGEDLNQIPGLTALLTTDLTMIHQAGMRAAIQNIL
ncbi:MAG: tagaturonate reductase [Bacteroidales bacterium]|nr:tagaturonate reductase [Bacteroidales bacterium]MBQ1680183.1 tagaturonate reductase [Bacteroidales bacterium]MBQ2148351.1 tagaturonate reductase [Bacteroidales bacterium]MBQ5518391.1 tagaturonate reductase [Bacteroidales bacterium]MBQ5529141.1 tagaturonate reductase [Bacteroidales bacterium]